MDWTGKKVKKLKRGFRTKAEALDWEKHFLLEKANSLDMTFGDFYKRYKEDVRPKVRENTWQNQMRELKTSDGGYFFGFFEFSTVRRCFVIC